MRKAAIVLLCLLLAIMVTACRQAPPKSDPPINPVVDKSAEFLRAAYHGKTEEVSSFLASGVDPNVKGTVGEYGLEATALHWAAKQGHLETVILLLSKKADVNSLTAPDASTPLMFAASSGHAVIVGLLLEHKADVNATDDHGTTALKSAAAHGHLAVVRTLIEKSTWLDFAARDQIEGMTAEDWARKNGHLEVAQLIKVSTGPQLELGNMAEAWLDSYKSLFVGTTFKSQSRTLVLVSLGQVDTLGYEVEISRIVDGPTEVLVEVRLTYPEPGKPYLVHPNTPYVLTEIPTTKPIVFMPQDPALHIPTLVGVPDGFLPHGESYWLEYVPDTMDSPERGNMRLGTTFGQDNVPGTIVIEGLARVFEAYVEYDFLDKSGMPYGYGWVHAATAAPDWGYFRFEASPSLDNLSGIRVYSTSAKDGSIQDLVIIRP